MTGISEFPLQNDPNQTNPYPYGPSNQQNFVGQQTQMGPIDHFAACNEGIAAGFGPMFFNMRDPNLGKTNHPVKQDPSLHAAVVVGSAILFAGIIVAVVGYYSLFHAQTLPIVLLIVLPYLLYVVLSICCSTIRGYITNLKRFE